LVLATDCLFPTLRSCRSVQDLKQPFVTKQSPDPGEMASQRLAMTCVVLREVNSPALPTGVSQGVNFGTPSQQNMMEPPLKNVNLIETSMDF
jgi:hypothetical protein